MRVISVDGDKKTQINAEVFTPASANDKPCMSGRDVPRRSEKVQLRWPPEQPRTTSTTAVGCCSGSWKNIVS